MTKIVGYTSGVFDLFHVGHVNVLRNARSLCDHLIVGISTDELVNEYKQKTPIIPFLERCEIVRHVKFVDTVVAQTSMNKLDPVEKFKIDIMFVGDDWFGTEKWDEIESKLGAHNVKLIYFPYTQGTSSTKINNILDSYRIKN